jgi:hypothetical protein
LCQRWRSRLPAVCTRSARRLPHSFFATSRLRSYHLAWTAAFALLLRHA